MKILWHKLFHGDKYDELLFNFGRDYYDHDYDSRTFSVCSKCGVHTEDFGYKYEHETSFQYVGELIHYVNYYPDDREYQKVLNKLLVRKLLK